MVSSGCSFLSDYRDASAPRKVQLLDEERDTIPFERVRCPDLRHIGESWLVLPRIGRDTLPRWSSFELRHFKSMLPKLCVLKVEKWREDRLEFSTYGGHATEFIGGGKPLVLQEMRHHPEHRGNYLDIRDRAGRAIDMSAPQYTRKTLSWNDRGFIEYEVLMLPFEKEGDVQRLLQPVSAWIERSDPELPMP